MCFICILLHAGMLGFIQHTGATLRDKSRLPESACGVREVMESARAEDVLD